MTQEEKDLLLKDLCARLPYGVRYRHFTWNDEFGEIYIAARIYSINTDGYVKNCYDDEIVYIDNVRPYLFHLSSMTEEQRQESESLAEVIKIPMYGEFLSPTPKYYDWLNKNHFDYKGLIPMGLAIDATGLNIY